VRGMFGGAPARILPLERRSKKQSAGSVARYTTGGMTERTSWYGISPVETCRSILRLNTGVWTA